MPNQDQMLSTAQPFVTVAGVSYKMPRLTIRTRRMAVAFVAEAETLQTREIADHEALNELMDALVTFLQGWLAKTYPEITREQIEEDWDTSDIPGLMGLILDFNGQIEAVSPPVSSVPRKRISRKK